MSTRWYLIAVAILGCLVLTGTALQAAEPTIDAAVPRYEQVPGISGNLTGVGSDTLNNMMDMWLEKFQELYPNVTGSYRGEGSSAAPPALKEGISQLGPMSRAMKNEELDAFEKALGYKPTEVVVALDCLAVFVHKDNPIKSLSLPQVDCIFSSTRNSGYRDIGTWGRAGLRDNPSWASKPISLYGRNSVSGTYGFFKEKALFKGDFKNAVNEQPGSAAVINAIANDPQGIGYSGIGYLTADVRALPLAPGFKRGELDSGSEDAQELLRPAAPTFENALAGDYPLGRALYIYVNKKPNEPLPSLVHEFLKFVLSKQGQQVVASDGFGPLPAAAVEENLAKLE